MSFAIHTLSTGAASSASVSVSLTHSDTDVLKGSHSKSVRSNGRGRRNINKSPNTQWDDALNAIAVSQDKTAFRKLFSYFAPRVKAMLMKLGMSSENAEEITQEVFVIVWRKAHQFDCAKATASTWIFTIARNKRIDRLRAMGRPEPDPNDPAFEPDPPQQSDALLTAQQRSDKVRDAVATLPEDQRDVLIRSYFNEQTQAEIAEETNTPLGTVKSRLRLALGKLKDALAKDMEDGAL